MTPCRFAVALLAGCLTGSAAAAHEFVVYFRFGSAEFYTHPEAPLPDWPRLVVKDAACYARPSGATRVHVVAHSDTAGDPARNLELSRRRAEAVVALLVEEGVNSAKITFDARGETQPAVPTGDGVREPLNRRATIDIFLGGEDPLPKCEGPTLPKMPPLPPPSTPR